MPNRVLRPDELPSSPSERNFFYCPDPLLMTAEEMEANFPRERRVEFFRDLLKQKRPAPVSSVQAVPEIAGVHS